LRSLSSFPTRRSSDLFVGCDPPLEEIPVDFRGRCARDDFLFTAANRGTFGVTENFEPDELIDVAGGQGGLVKLHAKLLHANRGEDRKSTRLNSSHLGI